MLLHRLGNTTQLLATLGSLLALGPAEALLAERADDLTEASRRSDELGYVLAVLASACGADLLLERRERRGLAWLVDAARESLRRDGRDVALDPRDLPDLAPDVASGWELPWTVAALLHLAGSSLAPGTCLAASLDREGDGWVLTAEGDLGADGDGVERRVAARLTGATFTRDSGRVRLVLPSSWLCPRD